MGRGSTSANGAHAAESTLARAANAASFSSSSSSSTSSFSSSAMNAASAPQSRVDATIPRGRNTASPRSPPSSFSRGSSRKKPIPSASPAHLRILVFQMLLIVVSIGRVAMHSFSVYLWHLDKPVVSFLGFAALMSAKPLIMAVVRTAVGQMRANRRVTVGAAIRLLLLLPVVFWLFQCFRELWWTHDWHIVVLCWGPALLRASLLRMGPSSEAIRRLWYHAGPPHYKPGAMADILKYLARYGTLRLLETTWYFTILPFLLIPDDHAVMGWLECIVLGVCGGLDLIALECTQPYCSYWERLYDCACMLGRWQPCRTTGGQTWTAGQVWARGDVVRHRKKFYKALDQKNTAEPSNRLSRVFWSLFRHPASAMAQVALIQIGVIVVQFLGLLLARHWFMVSVWGGSILLSYMSLSHTLALRRGMLRECARMQHASPNQIAAKYWH